MEEKKFVFLAVVVVDFLVVDVVKESEKGLK